MNDVIERRAEWTESLDDQLIELYGTDNTHSQIGNILGFKRAQIAGRISVLIGKGLLEPRGPLYQNKHKWTEADDAKLKQMYADDIPIEHISNSFKISKQLIHKRLGEKLPEWGLARRGNIVDVEKLKPKFTHAVPDVGVEPKYLPLQHLSLKSCRYPVNSPPVGGEYLFCGHEAKGKSPYCDAHHKLCNRKRIVDQSERQSVRRKIAS